MPAASLSGDPAILPDSDYTWAMRGRGRGIGPDEVHGAAMRRLAGEPPYRVLVALSGGADSTALLALAATAGSSGAQGVAACFVDHGARGDEDSVAAGFCHELCARFGARFVETSVDIETAGQGWEDAARRARYEALEDARQEAGVDWILTAHTADDVAETVLWRLARGSSSRGLGGIPPASGHVLRPLLELRRTQLRRWLRDLPELEGLAPPESPGSAGPWLEDSTNADESFLRNRIRAQVMPPLEAAVPQAVASISSAASLLREDDDYLDGLAREALAAAAISPPELEKAFKKGLDLAPGARVFSVSRLRMLPAPIARRAVRAALIDAGVPGDDLESRHILLIVQGLAKSRFALELPGGVTASLSRGFLILGSPGT